MSTELPPMLVVAALRWADSSPEVDVLTGTVRVDPDRAGPSEADRCALEQALRLAQGSGGRCVAVTAAPAGADSMLRDALAVGADAVLRLDVPAADAVTSVVDAGAVVARALIEAVTATHGRPDVVICGDYSADRGTGSTPAGMAATLGGTQALGLLEIVAGEPGLRVLRRLDGGRRERLAVELPAVCSVEPTDARLRPADPAAGTAARSVEIPVVPGPAAGDPRLRPLSVRPYRPRPRVLPPPPDLTPLQRLLAASGATPERSPARVVQPDTAAEAADELLGFLQEHHYLP